VSEFITQIMKINVDREACIGCGTCVALAPNTFELDVEGKSVVTNAAGDPEVDIRKAADACPVSAITFEEEVEEEKK
jgi:ferredoxin